MKLSKFWRYALNLLLLLVFACSSKGKKSDDVGLAESSLRQGVVATLEDLQYVDFSKPSEMNIVLAEGNPDADIPDRNKIADAEKLDAGTINTILSKLTPIAIATGDKLPFRKRADSPKTPKTGTIVKANFPSDSDLKPPTALASDHDILKVLRVQPEGPVPIVPQISITFNQPMVEITSHADTIAKGVPAKISPPVDGKWRWVGSKTLLFDPVDGRLPMATKYTVSIGEQTKSTLGDTLKKAKVFNFETPPPQVQQVWPGGGTYDLDQLIFVSFNQKIDPEKVMQHIEVKTSGDVFTKNKMELVQAEPEAIEKDENLKNYVENAKPNTFVVVRTKSKLPYDSTIVVNIKKGTPSAEGPLTTINDYSFNFRTYGPFKIVENRCGYSQCTPYDNFYFGLSNDMDMDKFDESKISVSPDFPAKTISGSGSWIYVNGLKPGRRTYKVVLPADLKDKYGQTITGPREFEYDVGPSQPAFYSTAGVFNVLDPYGEAGVTIYSTNYKEMQVDVYKVTSKDWTNYLKYNRDYRYYGKNEVRPPGRKIESRKIEINAKPDDLVETFVSLKKNLGSKGTGNLMLVLRPTKAARGTEMPEYKPFVRTWIQATQIGLDAMVEADNFSAWATSLKSGEPLSGVNFELSGTKNKGISDAQGFADLALGNNSDSKHAEILLATKGTDSAFLPRSLYRGVWNKHTLGDRLGWFVFDDRKMYKPSEEVSVKGWIRAIEYKKGGGVKLDAGAKKMTYTVYGSRGNKITSGKTKIGGLGGFSLKFKLPDTPNLGQARIDMQAVGAQSSGGRHTHSFQIQEFRTPEFEVKTDSGPGPHYADESTNVSVTAAYYAGGALGAAETRWSVKSTAASFRPPNQDKFSFGVWSPWWGWRYGNNIQGSKNTYKNFQAKTDASGVHNLKLTFSKISPPRPLTVVATATVMDVNRQAWTSSKSFLVHPSQYYVGLKTDKYFVKKGEPLVVDVILSDINGKLISDRPIKIKASRVLHKWKRNRYIEIEKDPQTCEITSAADVVKCTFETKEGGQYKIAASTMDDYKRGNYSQITRWVSGGNVPKSRRVEMEKVDLIPDKEEYQPGDVVEVLVQSPIVPAEGILTVRRSGIVEEKRFTMSESTMVLNVKVKESYLPGFTIQVNVNGSQPRLNADNEPDSSLPRRPALAQGNLNVKVPPYKKKLSVELIPIQSGVSPGENTSAKAIVKDADGKPVANAEVALLVVDEAILALSSYAMADPLSIFYITRGAGVSDFHSRTYIKLSDPAKIATVATGQAKNGRRNQIKRRAKKRRKNKVSSSKRESAPMAEVVEPLMLAKDRALGDDISKAGDQGGGASGQKIAVRSDFNPLATFAPAIKTNAQGIAKLNYKMPDNLTRYRIMAVAVKDASHYGTGESNVTARLPIMVRPSAPRFLNFGDKLEVPVVIQNQTDKEMSVSIAARASNIKYINATNNTLGLKVKVPANDRVEVRFPATTDEAGTARFQFGAVAGQHADAAEVSIPVWTPATSEAFATYGVIDKGAITQAVRRPTEVWPQFGGIEVSTSSTALSALTDAFLYLYHYEYQCAEQISSRMVSVAALRDVLSAFKAEGMPTKSAVEKSMKRDIKELTGRQNNDGGFGFWRRGQRSWPYVSIHAAHALARAKQKGYTVPANPMRRALNHLKNIERYIPGWYSEWSRRHIRAYALYVRGVAGDKDPKKARAIIKEAGDLKNLSFESVGWLLGVLTGDKNSVSDITKIRTFLNNRVTETAGNAHFASNTTDGDYVILHSDRVADGVILESLISDQPKSDLIPKIVSGLMAHRKRGRWGNTQENAFVLLALDKYFNTYENKTPDFMARVWLGDQYAGDHKFKGRTTEQHQIDIPMRYLPPKKASSNLIIQKDGIGRMYYRIGMKYAPKSLFSAAASHGFTVQRSYEPVDNDSDVKRRNDGTWEIKAGAKIKVKLTMLAPTRRYHVALVDPLPAGLEPENPALAVVGDVPENAASSTGRSGRGGWSYWWYNRPWFEHQNIRDERVEAFTSLLWGGVHTYSYYARATTPGQFVVPPTKAEEMYHPETFGRSASDRVDVVD